MNEYITAPNSNLKFLKPDFRCELVKVLDGRILAITDDLCGYYGRARWYKFDGSTVDTVKRYLTPYIEPKLWYDKPYNFPCLVVNVVNNGGHMQLATKYESSNNKTGFCAHGNHIAEYRLATNEEIDSLKVEDKLQKSITMDLIESEFIKTFGKKKFNDIQLQFNNKDKFTVDLNQDKIDNPNIEKQKQVKEWFLNIAKVYDMEKLKLLEAEKNVNFIESMEDK